MQRADKALPLPDRRHNRCCSWTARGSSSSRPKKRLPTSITRRLVDCARLILLATDRSSTSERLYTKYRSPPNYSEPDRARLLAIPRKSQANRWLGRVDSFESNHKDTEDPFEARYRNGGYQTAINRIHRRGLLLRRLQISRVFIVGLSSRARTRS